MAEGFSRRSWLVRAFWAILGLAGLRPHALAAPAPSRPKKVAAVLPKPRLWLTDPAGLVTTHTYDAQGRLTAESTLTQMTTCKYDGRASLAADDSLGLVTPYTYDIPSDGPATQPRPVVPPEPQENNPAFLRQLPELVRLHGKEAVQKVIDGL